MHRFNHGHSGFSLVETLIAMGVLTVGALGMAAVFAQGLKSTATSPNELLATQKAAEAIESVFSARDSKTLTWAQVRNTSDGGVFLGTATAMNVAGADGILNTGDGNETLESESLARFTRRIRITEVSGDLRSITVTIQYPAGQAMRTYVLTAYISRFA
jgi:prepilin-type N-terminal cleavage/methylation domain-containing protein